MRFLCFAMVGRRETGRWSDAPSKPNIFLIPVTESVRGTSVEIVEITDLVTEGSIYY
jgi:hypothetical protein